MNRVKLLFITVLGIVGLIAMALPASATVTGTVEFTCTADLDPFPAASGSGDCEGTAAVTGGGLTDDDVEYTVNGTGDLFAEFTYSEQCTAGEPVEGTASGEVTITDVAATYDGAPTTADLEAQFTWQRVGVTAVITITDVEITFDSTDDEAHNELDGVGEAAFAPTTVPDCNNPQHIRAEVVGAAEFAA